MTTTPKQGEPMNKIRTILTTAALVVLSAIAPAACANANVSASISQQQDETHGWRYRTGNVCVQDWTGGRASDGIKEAVVSWSRAEDLNLFYRTNCKAAGFKQNQTVTAVMYDGPDCGRHHVWTQHGYLKPGLITRAVIHISNSAACLQTKESRTHIATNGTGHVLGLDRPATRTYSVMVPGGWGDNYFRPTIWDYQRIEQLYPW